MVTHLLREDKLTREIDRKDLKKMPFARLLPEAEEVAIINRGSSK